MDKVLIIGATGGIGRLVMRRLLEEGRPVACLVRREAQAQQLAAAGAEALVGDLELLSAQELADFLRGSSTVIFAAGASEQGRAVVEAVQKPVAGNGSRSYRRHYRGGRCPSCRRTVNWRLKPAASPSLPVPFRVTGASLCRTALRDPCPLVGRSSE